MLSILIPSRNYPPEKLVKALQLQRAELSEEIELIVCDDGSQPPLQPIPEVIWLRNDSSMGRLFSRKRLAEQARHGHLLFLDADVLPVSDTFLKEYVALVPQCSAVLVGGITYGNQAPTGCELRYQFGKMREAKSAGKRNRNALRHYNSANFLIKKSIFLTLCNEVNTKAYGTDLLISQFFAAHQIQVKHLHNPVEHLGLEDNQTFLKKSLAAVHTLSKTLKGRPQTLNHRMGKWFVRLKKMKLLFIVRFFFKKFEKKMRKNLLGKNPSLLIFDLYRLGYLCILDEQEKTSN